MKFLKYLAGFLVFCCVFSILNNFLKFSPTAEERNKPHKTYNSPRDLFSHYREMETDDFEMEENFSYKMIQVRGVKVTEIKRNGDVRLGGIWCSTSSNQTDLLRKHKKNGKPLTVKGKGKKSFMYPNSIFLDDCIFM